MIELEIGERREQAPLDGKAYDRWLLPDGQITAQFHRSGDAIVVRFPAQVDFHVAPGSGSILASPAPGVSDDAVTTLFSNAIRPMLRNHAGQLNLHGSAVGVGSGSAAFLGISRSGKTTLAGAMAKLGHPFLTEDVVDLDNAGGNYLVQPCRPVLRLFDDSASFLLDREVGGAKAKKAVDASTTIPHADAPMPLSGIFLLGSGQTEQIAIKPLGEAQALAQLMQHSFILDCEDRERLKGHFGRLAELAQSVPCFMLDYPRKYDQLPQVREAIVAAIKEGKSQ